MRQINFMATVTLVYPYFRSKNDRSMFRFPPLGLGYIASYLEKHKISVNLVDCTFLNPKEALRRIKNGNSKIVGIYSMFSMKNNALRLARSIRPFCELLVAGGPLPTVNPEEFLNDFDIVVLGEGEQTMLEIVTETQGGGNFSKINGVAFKDAEKIVYTQKREFIENLDHIPFPSRKLFDNTKYQEYYSKFGYTTTSLISSRGCPFSCAFCSQPIFGNSVRFRSAENIVEEMNEIQKLGYGRIWFADDCFTINSERLSNICDLIIAQDLNINWECLSRVDTLDRKLANKMRRAGCVRVFFGIESGNDGVLELMNKQITTEKATAGVQIAKSEGLEVGAFFILGYPGETDETILDTVNFASSLPLDYCSFTFPYPIPGTQLYEEVKYNITNADPVGSSHLRLIDHELLFRSDFSETKLKFIIIKATVQFFFKKHIGSRCYNFLLKPLEHLTNKIFKLIH
jgi:anaerobic magnesium-protoporphyrin IX monomethyl ester cyclase